MADESDDLDYRLYADLIQEHEDYAARQEEEYNKESPTFSEAGSSQLVEDDEGAEVLEGTSCQLHVKKCCPFHVSCRGAKNHDVKMRQVPLFAKNALEAKQGAVLHDSTPFLWEAEVTTAFWHYRSHIRGMFTPHRIEQIDGVRALFIIWTFLSTVYESHNGAHGETDFVCGLPTGAGRNASHPINSVSRNGLMFADFSPGSILLSSGSYSSLNGLLFLSGFLLSKQLIEEYRQHGYLRVSYFYFRRLVRIVPAYFSCFFLYFFLRPQPQSCNVWTNAFFVNNFISAETDSGCYDNSWIISLFVQLFTILPFIILGMFVRGTSKRDGGVALGWRVPAVLVLVGLACRGFMLLGLSKDINRWHVSVKCKFDSWLFLKMSPFFVGVFFAMLQYEEVARDAQDLVHVRTSLPAGSLSPLTGRSPERRTRRESWESSDSMFDEANVVSASGNEHIFQAGRTARGGRRKGKCGVFINRWSPAVEICVALTVLVVTAVFSYHRSSTLLGMRMDVTLMLGGPTLFSIALGCLLSVVMRNRESVVAKFLAWSAFVPMSKCVYSMLLVQHVVTEETAFFVANSLQVSPTSNYVPWYFVTLFFCLVFSFVVGGLLYLLIEAPFRTCLNDKRKKIRMYQSS